MVIVTQPSHFQVTSEAEVPFISKAGGGNGKMGPRRWLARGLPGDVYEYSPTFNSSYIIYDEYGGTVPTTPALPTAGRLWLKPNTFLSVHFFSVLNQNDIGAAPVILPEFKSFRATRIRDVPSDSFYNYPNFLITDTLLPATKNLFNSNSFKNTVVFNFLTSRYNFATLPKRFSVKLFISWAKWTNKFRIPPPGAFPYGKKWYLRSATWATNPTATVGVGILHSIYIYR